ncbi:hypothetical protein Rhopal_003386-T1 [Rhodotorula paludigena]|uniref:Programmed cell death protein 2 C-terminal domain-containing protein n=1 Tax=Rhodotorula paludigena TaxID=86838 RepID=A0AAV5GLH6_9BASI|nr:hypothetical protein Rhopal_003386-T1 [Rhodotorula paludigena]
MPPPQATYVSRSSDRGYDPATLSDDEDDDAASVTSRSTRTSSAEGGETTILGLTDGRVPAAKLADLSDWKVSRVGGLPLHCPLPTSSLERVLYVFACPRPSCRRKDGAIRAWRANGVWLEGAEEARKAQEEAERREREAREREEVKKRAMAIDLGGLVFGGSGAGGGAASSASTGSSTTAAAAAAGSPFGTANANTTAPSAPFNPFAMPSKSNSGGSSSNPFAPAPSAAPKAAPNPFAVPASASASNPFVAPSSSAAPNPFVAPSPASPAPSSAADLVPFTSAASSSSLLAEPVTSSWLPSPTSPLPFYPPQYVATMYEPYAPSSSSTAAAKGKERDLAGALASGLSLDEPRSTLGAVDEDSNDDDDGDDGGDSRRPGKGAGGRTKKGAAGGQGRKDGSGRTKTSSSSSASGGGAGGWEKEGYEVQKVKGVDEVFLRFQERTAREGRQVVRYDFSAHPLPYTASSSAYRLLHPSASSSAHPMSAPASSSSAATAQPGTLGAYSATHAPPCRSCRGPSTFEAQLMPHLVGVLNSSGLALRTGSEDEGPGGKKVREEEQGAQDWASVWVLSCEAECAGGVDGGQEGENWKEERVLVELEEEAV